MEQVQDNDFIAHCELWRYNTEINEDGFFVDSLTQRVWNAWCESRRTAIVKLPCWSEYDTPRQAIDACIDRITDAGIGYDYN